MLPPEISLDFLLKNIARKGCGAARYLEMEFNLAEALDLRKLILLGAVDEPLRPLSEELDYFTPHEYVKAGAPYGGYGPYFLREQVAERLDDAQAKLDQALPGARLKIFDAFRPKSVQIYMRQLYYQKAVISLGHDLNNMAASQVDDAWRLVDTVWARPSNDPNLPTPHSTGAAIDLTIVDSQGAEIDMGCSIDEVSERILPSYYDRGGDIEAATFAKNRELLRSVMEGAGFYRLSHEWWHFSYGDQFWALIESLRTGRTVPAVYGEFIEDMS